MKHKTTLAWTFLGFLILVFSVRYYFIFWVILPKYKANLSTVLDDDWVEYAMNMSDVFLTDLFVWPLLLLFIALLRVRSLDTKNK